MVTADVDASARFRWTPRYGRPTGRAEIVAQTIWAHRVVLYIALVSTLTLAVMLFGVPAWIPGTP